MQLYIGREKGIALRCRRSEKEREKTLDPLRKLLFSLKFAPPFLFFSPPCWTMQSSSNHHVCFQPNATNDDGIDESPSARSRSSPPEVSSLTSPTTTTTHPPSTHMSPSYAAATSAWQPQSADEQPHPDPALLVSPSSSSDKSGIEGITITSKSTTEFTPPMTPSSERSESIGRAAVDGDEAEDGSEGGLRQRKHKGESKEKGGKEKKVPGAGFLQSLPGDVTEQRPMREDLGEKLDQPCTFSPLRVV